MPILMALLAVLCSVSVAAASTPPFPPKEMMQLKKALIEAEFLHFFPTSARADKDFWEAYEQARWVMTGSPVFNSFAEQADWLNKEPKHRPHVFRYVLANAAKRKGWLWAGYARDDRTGQLHVIHTQSSRYRVMQILYELCPERGCITTFSNGGVPASRDRLQAQWRSLWVCEGQYGIGVWRKRYTPPGRLRDAQKAKLTSPAHIKTCWHDKVLSADGSHPRL